MEWKPWEIELLYRKDLTLREIAAKTGRTYQAAKDKRYTLKHPDKVRLRRRKVERRREGKHFGKKAKFRGWTYLQDATLVALPWSVSSLVKHAEQEERTYAGVKSRRGKLSGLGVRTLTDLEGIYVDGVPLKTHLEEEQNDEIQKAYNAELKERSKSKGRVSRKGKMPVKEGVSKRVKRLRAHEIRKEYGLMQKRHTREEGGIGADCLWLIRFKSPMTANSAATILEGSRSSVSGIFSQLWRALGGKYIERGVTLPYEYTPMEEFDVTFVYGLVRKFYAEKSKKQRAKARGEIPEPPEPAAEPFYPEGEIENLHALFGRLKERINDLTNEVTDLNNSHGVIIDKVSENTEILKGLEGKVPVLLPELEKLAQEFDINFNVRFLFGRD